MSKTAADLLADLLAFEEQIEAQLLQRILLCPPRVFCKVGRFLRIQPVSGAAVALLYYFPGSQGFDLSSSISMAKEHVLLAY